MPDVNYIKRTNSPLDPDSQPVMKQWSRPVLQRLAAKEARHGNVCGNDGVGQGGCDPNNPINHGS
jgi:hypothetical protein